MKKSSVEIKPEETEAAKEWLREHKSEIPEHVLSVIEKHMLLPALLERTLGRFLVVKRFLATQLGIVPSTEKTCGMPGATQNKIAGWGSDVEQKTKLRGKRSIARRRGRKAKRPDKRPPLHMDRATEGETHLDIDTRAFGKPSVESSTIKNANLPSPQHPPMVPTGAGPAETSQSENVDKMGEFGRDKDDFESENFDFTSYNLRFSLEKRVTRCEKVTDLRTGKTATSRPKDVPKGSQHTFATRAFIAALHVGHQIPLTRISAMFSSASKSFSKSTLFSFITDVAEAFLPVFFFLVSELVGKAEIFETDDTKQRTLRALVDDLECSEEEIELTQALRIARAVHEEISLVARGEKGKPKRMNLTVLTGLIDANNPLSRVVLKLSHFGAAGDLLGRLVEKFRERSKTFWLVSDLSGVNIPRFVNSKGRDYSTAGCNAHARRGVWRCRHLDDELWAVIRGFNALAHLEEKLQRMNASDAKILAWRSRYGKLIWKWILHFCKQIQKRWKRETEPWKAVEYILSNEYTLRRYLKNPRLPMTNNRCERLLRTEKLMLATSKFRDQLGGRICYDIISSIMATCLAARVDFLAYTTDLLMHKTDVAMNPEAWTPLAWGARQQHIQK